MTAQPSTPVATSSSLDVREKIVEALHLDLVGPWAGHRHEHERLPGWIRPSGWYITGFLVPAGTPIEDAAAAEADDHIDEVPDSSGLTEESAEDRPAAKKGYFPSSMGLSFLVPHESQSLNVTIRWGDYEYEHDAATTEEGKSIDVWAREPHAVDLHLRIAENASRTEDIPDSRGLELHVVDHRISTDGFADIPPGSRSVSLFLVNKRRYGADAPDTTYAFQVELEVRSESQFVPQLDPRGAVAEDWDERVADLHYADTPAYATGHGVSAEWDCFDSVCRVLRTAWIPSAEVENTRPVPMQGVTLSMEALGALQSRADVKAALRPLAEHYRNWIDTSRAQLGEPSESRLETAEELLRFADLAAKRIERGIQSLVDDADVLDAFRVANRAVARAMRQRFPERFNEHPPSWYPFQLAFILLNIPGLSNPQDADRQIVDLLFFPTGGGKTEAYLGLAALAMTLRRLRNSGTDGLDGAGVSVIMRYTLRLLTLDQLSRAAGLVCALELERQRDAARYGSWPFEIGLWVGKAATPNRIGRKGDQRSDTARAKTRRFKGNPEVNPPPIPLESCPWCHRPFAPECFSLHPNDDTPRELRVVCANWECEFSGDNPLPIIAVDEPIYRRLPSFLIATVDKFASLPWESRSGALLGGSTRYDREGFYGAAEPRLSARRLSAPLPPPDLVIQDELHLISGPLGTMAGLYEAAIEALCVTSDGVRPKIVASTATIRHARDQIQALFARSLTRVFPPPGPNRRDSCFARIMPAAESAARRYVGIAAQGRSAKVLMRRVILALMGSAQRLYIGAGGVKNLSNPADPYMTVLGYFNSLKELGGARRVLEEEVRNTLKRVSRRRRIDEKSGLFRDRNVYRDVVELTSRVPTDKVAEARRRLSNAFHEELPVDWAIATNMISVGLDIQRLGLMVVVGQPKTHAEYIQATSRVGRDDEKPGLVVTLLNVHRPRDRSHYERFRHYHETFYRSVEVPSVTPFSARALDRGFAGALVGLARHSQSALTPPTGVEKIKEMRSALENHLSDVFLDRINDQDYPSEEERTALIRSVRNRIVDLLDSWLAIVDDYQSEGVGMNYQRYEHPQRPKFLLREMLEREFESEHHRKFRTNRSLRDVEPEVHIYLDRWSGGG